MTRLQLPLTAWPRLTPCTLHQTALLSTPPCYDTLRPPFQLLSFFLLLCSQLMLL